MIRVPRISAIAAALGSVGFFYWQAAYQKAAGHSAIAFIAALLAILWAAIVLVWALE